MGPALSGNAAGARLRWAVALIAAAMLALELLLTRLFSVVFLYHYSFFAVSLVMSGLALGGVAASWLPETGEDEGHWTGLLAALALLFAWASLAGVLFFLAILRFWPAPDVSLLSVGLLAVAFLPGLGAAGAFLAAAFARHRDRIGPLYAADLAGAALACAGSIWVMRWLPGPAGMLVPVALAALAGLVLGAGSPRVRRGLVLLGAVACALGAVDGWAGWRLMRLPRAPFAVLERWNEHSRIQASTNPRDPRNIHILIDKSAATYMPKTWPRAEGERPRLDPTWLTTINNLAYRLGRKVERSAIIGVGGGTDLLGPISVGAGDVDGYELNRIMIDLITRDFAAWSGFAAWPEIHLIHNEGRIGVAHSGKRYDTIQASLIDTWAATASGGFVLSENGLYTIEAWRIFLRALSDRGALTMTRWLLPRTPAETLRLLALASAAVEAEGLGPPAERIALATTISGGEVDLNQSQVMERATIIVSRAPITPGEVERLRLSCERDGFKLLVAPGMTPWRPEAADLLDPARREAAIAASPYDISLPTDERPYFFLQVRPRDALKLTGGDQGEIYQITFNGVRVMVTLAGLSALFAAAVWCLGAMGKNSADAPRGLRVTLSLYFLFIGLGYILVQLGLHQRMSILLGRPTYALSVVLFSMLLGTGAGSALSSRLDRGAGFVAAWIAIVALLLGLVAAFGLFGGLDAVGSTALRATACAAVAMLVGLALGFGFPMGMRLAGEAGEAFAQRLWAINGAASISGSTLAAILGVAYGSRWVVGAGSVCYVAALLCGVAALTASRRRA